MAQEQKKATLVLTLDEIQIFNAIVASSTPNVPFATVSQFVGNVNKQLQEQFKDEIAKEQAEQEDVPAPKASKLKKV